MLILTHSACLDHDTGAGHPESADRLRAVLEAINRFKHGHEVDIIDAPLASREALLRVHTDNYLKKLEQQFPQQGRAWLDADTKISSGSCEAAWRAAGAVEYATTRIFAGRSKRAFCAVRPPGHHAEPDQAMGFCLFNNVAVGAAAALDCGMKRITIMDFDVHHGNGTAKMFRNEPRIQYCSLFEHPLYPQREEEPGLNDVFIPLSAGTNGEQYRRIFIEQVEPQLQAYQPELIFISAGFDAHANDPLAGLGLEDDDYSWLTNRIVAVAEGSAQGRVISVLEGGYNLSNLYSATLAHLTALARA